MNHAKEWSFLWIGDPVEEEEEEGDVSEADSHGWSQEVWVLLPHLSGFSCSIRCDQGHGAAATLTGIFFSIGKWGIVILLLEFFPFLGRCWSLQCRPGELLLRAEMLHLAGQSGQCLCKPVSGTLCQTQLLPFHSSFLAWDQFLPLGNDLADLATVSVASCGQPPALQQGRCPWQHVLIPVSRGLTAGDKVS